MRFSTESLSAFLHDILDTRFFEPDSEYNDTPAIEAVLEVGPPFYPMANNSKLVVITGENATGKSIVRRLVQVAGKDSKTEVIHLSQEGRSGSGNGIMRACVYGAEDWESTGYISAHTVKGAIKTSRSRDHKHIIFWDEPDIGLSDNYAAGVGIQIREFVQNSPEKLFAAFVVSHSKPLIEQLLPANPFHLRLGSYMDLKSFVTSPVIPRDPELLHMEGHARFKRITKFLKS